ADNQATCGLAGDATQGTGDTDRLQRSTYPAASNDVATRGSGRQEIRDGSAWDHERWFIDIADDHADQGPAVIKGRSASIERSRSRVQADRQLWRYALTGSAPHHSEPSDGCRVMVRGEDQEHRAGVWACCRSD